VYQDCGLLGRDTIKFGKHAATFSGHLLPSSSEYKGITHEEKRDGYEMKKPAPSITVAQWYQSHSATLQTTITQYPNTAKTSNLMSKN
jgi:hypothetical protein